jgi:hypothetical protein
VLRDLIAKHTGRSLPEPPPRPAIRSYGKVDVKESLPLMEAVPALFSGGGIRAEVPDIMEEYGQRWGLILYRTRLPAKALEKDGALDLGGAPHDYATVFVDGELAGRLDRSEPATNLTLRARHAQGKGKGNQIQLDILVEVRPDFVFSKQYSSTALLLLAAGSLLNLPFIPLQPTHTGAAVFCCNRHCTT